MPIHAAFRRGNDAIAHAARRASVYDNKIDFICECLDIECLGRVPLTLKDYEQMRANGRAVTLLGHAGPE